MPTSTYIPMANITLGSTAASVVFSSISQSYRDLMLVITIPSGFDANSDIRINSDTNYSNNYSRIRMYGNGTSAVHDANSGSSNPAANHDFGGLRANSHTIMQFMDYSATDKHKNILVSNAAPNNYTQALITRWASTAAITNIDLRATSQNLPVGATFALYGVAA